MMGEKPYHIVVAEPFDPLAMAKLEEIGKVTVLTDSAPQTLLDAVSGADALLVRNKAHVTARIIDAAPKLKVIGRASPNIDHIDLKAARRRNISVVYAPHVAITSTAEFTLALILAVHRRICFYDAEFRDGKFETLRTPVGHEMGHLTMGFLGVDPVAEQLGRILTHGFKMRVIYHDPTGKTAHEFEGTSVSLEELLSSADVLSIHLTLSNQNRGIINADLLGKLKPSSILVNTSRGPLVDCTALAGVLRKKQIAGAALDVFDTEPLPGDHPLRRAPNCILTPHVAGATLDASAERFQVTEDVVRVLTGQAPRYPVALPAT
jgi:D-3-phosphoglycerate dehydrogenase